MALILLIMQIVSAIPTIISIVKMIIDLIHGLPAGERKAAEGQLRGILKKHLKTKDAPACQAELEAFHSDLKGKYGV